MIPMRHVFRSRWAALAWAVGICWTAISFAGGEHATVNAANSADDTTASVKALLAEDPD